ncbi:RDD family protein [Cellvibrio mixtus]|uniref:RDD family protein n=1 Tax=Cellvibrio mixtus TaxID=39650 RepID=UPI0005878921|nr:RDD family protein [Cellvibrio mixtus]
MKKKPTPEPVAQEFATPGLLRRFAAMVYDSLLLMAVSILYGAIATGINIAIKGIPAPGERVTWGAFGIVVFIGWILTLGFFFCYFWKNSGQTLGMKTWRMKMYDANSMQTPGYSQCVIRCVCAPFSMLLLGIGYWVMYLNPERQTLHDKLSKTRILLLAKDKK